MNELAAPVGASPGSATADDGKQRVAAGSADEDGVPALSASIAHLIVTKSALHAWHAHPRLNPNYVEDVSDEFDFGTAAHDLLLEGGTARICVIDPENYRSKPTKANPEGAVPKGWTNGAIRAARDEARANRLVPILPWHNARLSSMIEVAQRYLAQSELAELLLDGKPEQKLHWQEGGAHCRARLDWITGDKALILDYKSCRSANPHHFTGMAVSFGYTMQEAFYRRGVKAVHGKEPRFVFLLQEKEPPFACSLVAFDPAMQEIGDRQAQYAIALWTHAMQTGQWPGYPSRVAHLEPPAWLLARAEGWATDDNLEELAQA